MCRHHDHFFVRLSIHLLFGVFLTNCIAEAPNHFDGDDDPPGGSGPYSEDAGVGGVRALDSSAEAPPPDARREPLRAVDSSSPPPPPPREYPPSEAISRLQSDSTCALRLFDPSTDQWSVGLLHRRWRRGACDRLDTDGARIGTWTWETEPDGTVHERGPGQQRHTWDPAERTWTFADETTAVTAVEQFDEHGRLWRSDHFDAGERTWWSQWTYDGPGVEWVTYEDSVGDRFEHTLDASGRLVHAIGILFSREREFWFERDANGRVIAIDERVGGHVGRHTIREYAYDDSGRLVYSSTNDGDRVGWGDIEETTRYAQSSPTDGRCRPLERRTWRADPATGDRRPATGETTVEAIEQFHYRADGTSLGEYADLAEWSVYGDTPRFWRIESDASGRMLEHARFRCGFEGPPQQRERWRYDAHRFVSYHSFEGCALGQRGLDTPCDHEGPFISCVDDDYDDESEFERRWQTHCELAEPLSVCSWCRHGLHSGRCHSRPNKNPRQDARPLLTTR